MNKQMHKNEQLDKQGKASQSQISDTAIRLVKVERIPRSRAEFSLAVSNASSTVLLARRGKWSGPIGHQHETRNRVSQ